MWIQHPQILGKSHPTWICSGHTCRFLVTQQLPCYRSGDVMRWRYLGWPVKVPGACQLVLQLFIVLDLGLRLKVRYLKLELKFLVGYLICDLITWLLWNGNCSIKNNKISDVTGLLNRATCFSRFVMT